MFVPADPPLRFPPEPAESDLWCPPLRVIVDGENRSYTVTLPAGPILPDGHTVCLSTGRTR